jgi:FlgD Ig-like domain
LIVLAVALLVGSAAAFTRSERLKLAPSPLGKPKFGQHLSPTCDCPQATSRLSFLLRRPERLDVSVVDSDGGHVATLMDSEEVRAGRIVFSWDGRDDDGQVVPDGLYRVKVRLEHDRRTILIPKTVLVDTKPPRLRVLEAVTTNEGALVRYRTNEAVRVRVVSNGERIATRRRSRPGAGRITWTTTDVPPLGEFTLVAVDRVGNRTKSMPFSIATP